MATQVTVLKGADALRKVQIHDVVEQHLGLRSLLETSVRSSNRPLVGFKSDGAPAYRRQACDQEPVTASDIERSAAAQRRVPHNAPVKGDVVIPVVTGHCGSLVEQPPRSDRLCRSRSWGSQPGR